MIFNFGLNLLRKSHLTNNIIKYSKTELENLFIPETENIIDKIIIYL